jgi:hypothetical protein
MPFPRSRKLRQSPSAHPAINTTHSVHAEPERSTSLTYFYIHAQVVHRSLSRRASPPASLGHFLRSSGLTQVAMKCLLPARGALTAPSVRLWHSSVVGQCCCSTLGKIKATLHPSTWFSDTALVVHLCRMSPLRLPDSQNGKFQGYSFRQTLCQQQSFLRQFCTVNHPEAVVYEQNMLL